jgi:transposase
LLSDFDAKNNAGIITYSNGEVEGQINKFNLKISKKGVCMEV